MQNKLGSVAPSRFKWKDLPLPLAVDLLVEPGTPPKVDLSVEEEVQTDSLVEVDDSPTFEFLFAKARKKIQGSEWALGVDELIAMVPAHDENREELVSALMDSFDSVPGDIQTNAEYLPVLKTLESDFSIPVAGYHANFIAAHQAQQENQWSLALEELCRNFSAFPDDEGVSQAIDRCVGEIPSGVEVDDDLLLSLEECVNHGSVASMLKLGWINECELNEYDLAIENYELVLKREGTECIQEANWRIAVTRLKRGDEGDLESAVSSLEEQHQAGDWRASDLLAQCYAKGKGVELDEEAAFALFQGAWDKSGEQETPYYTALHNLGVCYLKAKGVRRNRDTAFEHFQTGAEEGSHPGCMRSLATCYQKGYGVNPDPQSSQKWLQLSEEVS